MPPLFVADAAVIEARHEMSRHCVARVMACGGIWWDFTECPTGCRDMPLHARCHDMPWHVPDSTIMSQTHDDIDKSTLRPVFVVYTCFYNIIPSKSSEEVRKRRYICRLDVFVLLTLALAWDSSTCIPDEGAHPVTRAIEAPHAPCEAEFL